MRALPGNLETIMPLLGPTPHGYFTKHPREMVESTDYFLPVFNRLKRGDRIEITYDLGDQLIWVNYMVIQSERKAVHIRIINEFQVSVEPVKEPEPAPKRQPETYAPEGFEAKWAGRHDKWRVVDAKGNVIKKGLEKDEAFALAGGHKALEVA